MTIVDGFTKYLFVRAVKSTKTKHTVKVLENLFYDFGLPSRIISDRGTSFTSTAFQKFCDVHGIKHTLNAVACPRSNGQAERYNQMILQAMSKLNVNTDERNWDVQLGRIQWGINNTINSTTKKTASEVMFGIRLRDSLLNKLDIGEDQPSVDLQGIREETDNNIREIRAKQKRRYDDDMTPAAVYKKGDLVKITRTNFYNYGNSKKLLSKFVGPYKVVESIGHDRYEITNVPGFSNKKKRVETVVAANRI